jgi:hypothetical protein
MIVWASAALMSWELVAKATHRPTITDLSHRTPYGFMVYGWLCWMLCHFVGEAVRGR